MRHIKTYENTIDNPKLGDYVICFEKLDIDNDDDNNDYMEFLSNNIGKIVLIDYYRGNSIKFDYLVEYNNIPKKLTVYFQDYDIPNTRPMDIDEIVEFSESKEDLVMKITSNKYNL